MLAAPFPAVLRAHFGNAKLDTDHPLRGRRQVLDMVASFVRRRSAQSLSGMRCCEL